MRVLALNMWGQLSTGNIATNILKQIDCEKKLLYRYGNCQEDFAQKVGCTFIDKCFNYISDKFAYKFRLDGFLHYHLTHKIINEIKKFMPDIIHLHNLHGIFLNLPMLLKYLKKKNIAVVWTLHDCWTFTGHCGYFDFVQCSQWKDGCEHCKNLLLYTVARSENQVKKYFDLKKKYINDLHKIVFVTPSIWLADLAKQSHLKNKGIVIINNGVDLTNFKPVDNHTFDKKIDRTKKILLGVASPFSERKGYADYIKLNEIIDKKVYQIVMVGVNQEQIDELNKCDIIGIERTFNQIELAELYSLAYCFINMTYEDNFPTVNLEALSCGCPIISYSTGGCVEIINESNGILVEKGDYSSVVKELPNMEKFRKNKETIMQDCRDKYSIELMAKSYYEIYKTILQK